MGVDTRTADIEILLKKQRLLLLPEKAIFWPQQSTLIVADLHLGKAGHFRKHGLAVPAHVHATDLQCLAGLIARTKVRNVIFLGDLFHSEANSEWHSFSEWLDSFKEVKFILVEGNHDILPIQAYLSVGFQLFQELRIGPFSFTHEKSENTGAYNFSGHIHPGIKLYGQAKQGIRLPCFYFARNYAYLPAFGAFTGIHPIRKRKEDKVFAIADGRLISLNN